MITDYWVRFGGRVSAGGFARVVGRNLTGQAGTAERWTITLGVAGGIAIVYFLAARLGLALLAAPSDVAVFWPASGLAAGILVITGGRAAPAIVFGVVIGTVAANLMSDRSVLVSISKGICNAGEAV